MVVTVHEQTDSPSYRFGYKNGDYWIGLQNMYHLTKQLRFRQLLTTFLFDFQKIIISYSWAILFLKNKMKLSPVPEVDGPYEMVQEWLKRHISNAFQNFLSSFETRILTN